MRALSPKAPPPRKLHIRLGGLHAPAGLALDSFVIVTCPNCGARYRLSEAVVARRARLKCAACAHRWVPDEAVEAAEASETDPSPARQAPAAPTPPDKPPAAPPEAGLDPAPVPDEPAPVTDDTAANDDDAPRSHPVRNAIAVVLALALAAAAAGLWVGRVDPRQVPVIGEQLARLVPTGQPLQVTVAGTVTELPSGGRVLEVTGTITNPGRSLARVPLLKASLVGPTGPARRWTISPPAAQLAPGATVAYSSTVMGFPADARTLAVAPGR